MSMVYIVSDGSYSDYHILGIYDTAEKAASAREIYNADNDVQEMELNFVPESPPGLVSWHVNIQKDGCTAKACRRGPLDPGEGEPLFDVNQIMTIAVWAKDETHAIKVANEKRIQALALRALYGSPRLGF